MKYAKSFLWNGELDLDSYKSNPGRINKHVNEGEFGQVLAKIGKTSSEKTAYNLMLKKIVPDLKDWTLETIMNRDFVLFETAGEIKHTVGLTGDGVINAFRLIAHLFSPSSINLLSIDEPCLSLHPHAVKRLAHLILEASKNRQIVIATHSPYFINWKSVENGAKIIRFGKPNGAKFTKAYPLTNSNLSYKNFIRIGQNGLNRHLIDTSCKAALFSQNVVFVEGHEDSGLIRSFIEDNELDYNFEIFGYGSGGGGNIIPLLLFGTELGIATGALYDGDRKKDFGVATKDFPNSIIQILPTDDIRDKQTLGSGFFDNSGNIHQNRHQELKNILDKFHKGFEGEKI